MTDRIGFEAAPDRPNENFVMIHNDRVRNAGPVTLRGMALALHHYLLSLAPGQMMPMDEIWQRVFPLDSRESVRKAARDLRAAGLLVLLTEQHPDGRFTKRYRVFHNPQPITFPQVAPNAVKPAFGRTADKNRRLRTGPVPVRPLRATPSPRSSAQRGEAVGRTRPRAPLHGPDGEGLTQARTDPRSAA